MDSVGYITYHNTPTTLAVAQIANYNQQLATQYTMISVLKSLRNITCHKIL